MLVVGGVKTGAREGLARAIERLSTVKSNPLPQTSRNTSRPIVFRARSLAKTYVMGEIKVHALRDVNIDIYEGEFVCLGPPARENQHFSTFLEASTRPQAAKPRGATIILSQPMGPN